MRMSEASKTASISVRFVIVCLLAMVLLGVSPSGSAAQAPSSSLAGERIDVHSPRHVNHEIASALS